MRGCLQSAQLFSACSAGLVALRGFLRGFHMVVLNSRPMRLNVGPLIVACAAMALTAPAWGAAIVVTVVDVKSDQGFVGCALFAADAAALFPLDLSRAVTQRTAASTATQTGRMRCEFLDLAPGSYAVSAAHDINGNGKTDRNFVGLPTEPWAVSNNVRPTLRAPRFNEAVFTVAAEEVKQVELRLAP
jgi:uncharacterized protein (DUF2141 family)